MSDHIKRVLVVEDEEEIQAAYNAILDNKGYHVEFADNGRIGFRKASTFDYDIIMFDLHMPEWNGVDAIKGILLVKPKCKFLVISGYADCQIADGLRLLPEVLAILKKPASVADILKYVEAA